MLEGLAQIQNFEFCRRLLAFAVCLPLFAVCLLPNTVKGTVTIADDDGLSKRAETAAHHRGR